jgi:hypothetical protein
MTTQISEHGKAPKGTHFHLSFIFSFSLPQSDFSFLPKSNFFHPLHVKVVCHAWVCNLPLALTGTPLANEAVADCLQAASLCGVTGIFIS